MKPNTTHLVVFALACLAVPRASFSSALPDADMKLLQGAVIPAARRADRAELLRLLVPLSNRWSHEQLAEADELMEEAKLPSTSELLVDTRLSLLANPLPKRRQPPPTARETLLLLPAILKRIETTRAEVAAMQQQIQRELPVGFLDYERLYESLHALKHRTRGTILYSEYAAKLPTRSRRLRTPLNAIQQAAFDADYAKAAVEMRGQLRDLVLAEVDLRMDRLRDIDAVLRLSPDRDERFQAACSLLADMSYFAPFLPQEKVEQLVGNEFHQDDAGDNQVMADLRDELTQLVPRAREAAGERLLTQAYHFSEGLRWWLRGRYGLGPVGNGLLKTTAAKRDPRHDRLVYPHHDTAGG